MKQKFDNSNNDLSKLTSKISLISTIVILFVLIVVAILSVIYLRPVDIDNEEYIEYKLIEGSSKSSVAKELSEMNLIRSNFFFKVYMKLNNKEIYPGTYKLSKSMSLDEIIDVLNTGNTLESETIKVTFIEGKRLTSYVKQISETFNYEQEEILDKLNNQEYLKTLIEKYSFLTDDILKEEIKQPLEGYLFPDTYIIRKNASIEDIIEIMLNTMEDKLSVYEEEIKVSHYKINEIITMASIVELESFKPEDRLKIAGVFYNRLDSNMSLGSCVTTYYAVNKNFDEELYQRDLDVCDPYNTRGTCAEGLPPGPIASPSLASLAAAIAPEEHDYYYFVSDKERNTYFTKTLSEHEAKIKELQRNNDWYDF